MLYLNPDPKKAASLEQLYSRRARTNSIIAWSLLATGLILPMALSGDEYNSTTDKIASISRFGIIASLPFFMEAAKNKGRISVLTHTERVTNSYIPGPSMHRSIGLGLPIGK